METPSRIAGTSSDGLLQTSCLSPTRTRALSGKFVKIVVEGTPKAGQYRGQGKLEVTPSGLVVTGAHVYSLGQRWLFAIGITVLIAVLTAGTFAPGILLLYGVVEYLWLKKGNQTIPFNRIQAYKTVPKKKLIAIQFKGTPWETPIVMKSEHWRVLYDALVSHIPRAKIDA
jgi:hypothetical protein